MLALTRGDVEYGYLIKHWRNVLKNRREYLLTGPTRDDVRSQGKDIKMAGAGDWKKRGPIRFSDVTREFYQWWDHVERGGESK